jgi:hypothetical protein
VQQDMEALAESGPSVEALSQELKEV